MIKIQAYSQEILILERNSIYEDEIIKEWVKEELSGIKDKEEISNAIQEILELKNGEEYVVWHNDKQLIRARRLPS